MIAFRTLSIPKRQACEIHAVRVATWAVPRQRTSSLPFSVLPIAERTATRWTVATEPRGPANCREDSAEYDHSSGPTNMNIDIHPSGYFALVLHRPSQERLLTRYASLPFRIGHHCTVAYGTDQVVELPPAFGPGDLGKEFQLRVTGYAIRGDRRIEAVAVELLDADGDPIQSPFSTNRVPHVTLATDGRTPPVASNALLEEGFAATDGLVLSCTLMHVRAQDETIRSHPEICMAGDDILRRIADPLSAEEITCAATRKLISRMHRILQDSLGVGLAAPQIGVSKRVICVEMKRVKRTFYDPAQFATMEREVVRIPGHSGHRFHGKPATHSRPMRPLIPREAGHLFQGFRPPIPRQAGHPRYADGALTDAG